MYRTALLTAALVIASFTAQATDKSPAKGKLATSDKKEQAAHPRKEGPAFVDPTMEFAAFVERVRTEQASITVR